MARRGRKRAKKAPAKAKPAPPAKRAAPAETVPDEPEPEREFTNFKYKIHRVSFYQPEAKAINVLAYDNDTARLAVVRGDFTIEIWNLMFTACVEGVMLGCPNNSVESVVWHRGRLFTSGLHGCIVEYNLVSLQKKYSVTVSSGAAWCMEQDYQKTRLAVGTEEGCVAIYKFTAEGIQFVRNLNKQKGRILCLAWSREGDTIVTGSVDTVGIWNVKTGSLVDRISVGRLQKEKETVVWSIALTSDFTIITGDSCGRTCFWDGRTATLTSSFKAHSADVLKVCLSQDEEKLWSAGVDPAVIEFAKISDVCNRTHMWTKSLQRTCHTHDVRAMAYARGHLVTGGVDTYLVLSTRLSVVKHAPFQRKVVQLAATSQHVLVMYDKELELWRLGSPAVAEAPTGTRLPLAVKPVMVARVVARSNGRFEAAALSDDGVWLCCTDAISSLLYQIEHRSEGQPKFEKIRSFVEQMGPAKQLLFTKSASHLVAIDHRGAIHVFSLPPILLHTISPDPGSTARPYLACMSPKDHLAVADNEHNIVIYDVKSPAVAYRLPQTQGMATAMRFNPMSSDLVIIYNDNQVVEYSVEDKSYTKWCRDVYLAGGLTLRSMSPLTAITFDPALEDIFFAYSDHELFVIDRQKAKQNTKKPERMDQAVRISRTFKWLAFFEHIEGNEVMIIEVPPDQIIEGLPVPLWQKRFGT